MARPDLPTAAPARSEAQEVERSILDTYDKLHEGKLGAHWLWCVIEQIAAGVPEDEAMREFGYYERQEQEDQPVAWLTIRPADGLVEQAEPHEKATNPKHWTDAFPVYRRAAGAAVPAGGIVIRGDLPCIIDGIAVAAPTPTPVQGRKP